MVWGQWASGGWRGVREGSQGLGVGVDKGAAGKAHGAGERSTSCALAPAAKGPSVVCSRSSVLIAQRGRNPVLQTGKASHVGCDFPKVTLGEPSPAVPNRVAGLLSAGLRGGRRGSMSRGMGSQLGKLISADH